jgi:hypothetical protein
MGRRRRHLERSEEPVARSPQPRPAEALAGVEALQRSAGNAALASVLSVRRAPAAEEVTGMRAHFAVEQYVQVAKALQANWARLESPRSKANVLIGGVNFELAHFDVPTVDFDMKDLETDNAQWDSAGWQVLVNPERFKKAAVTDDEAADVAKTVYHESRHAEQDFRVARMLAGRKMKAGDIAEKLDMPERIAAAAKKQPLTGKGRDEREAEGWFESEHGKGSDARIATLEKLEQTTLELRAAQIAAQTAFTEDARKAADARLEAAKKAHDEAMAGYYALPEEGDASAAGADVKATFKGKKP